MVTLIVLIPLRYYFPQTLPIPRTVLILAEALRLHLHWGISVITGLSPILSVFMYLKELKIATPDPATQVIKTANELTSKVMSGIVVYPITARKSSKLANCNLLPTYLFTGTIFPDIP
jgi:hypothetical protein